MINVRYSIIEEKHNVGGNTRISYGIAAYSVAGDDGSTVVASVHDVTSDRDRLSELVDTCNGLRLSTVHLADVVEDFLNG